jgi:hypothetical protein
MQSERIVRPSVLTVASTFLSVALAHATLVFVAVTTEPSPALAGQPTTLHIEMQDPVGAPVEDAIVFVEATSPDGSATVASDQFGEIAPGVYTTTLQLEREGPWTLLFRDRTFRQEEAQATLDLTVGPGGSSEALTFIFPPTATGPQSLTTWLVWLIGLPLVAGAVVTVMVLRGGNEPSDPAEDSPAGA